MEAPYAYIFAGRQDKTCEIVSAGHEYMFTTGRGGIPGNNDSGGLSSCYIWNTLGIFPVAGQDLMLLGSPRIKGAALSLGNGRELVIEVHGKGIYLDRATINGKKIENFRFTVREMMEGGKLEMFMKSESKGD
jgi:putative alpha-1,2-mannosidase